MQKAEFLARFRASGLSQHEFARGQNMCAANLSRWLRQQEAGHRAASLADGPLVEVPMAALGDGTRQSHPVKFYLPGGVQLEVAAGTDTAWLGQLLHTLAP